MHLIYSGSIPLIYVLNLQLLVLGQISELLTHSLNVFEIVCVVEYSRSWE
jgi:hypothetical protein